MVLAPATDKFLIKNNTAPKNRAYNYAYIFIKNANLCTKTVRKNIKNKCIMPNFMTK